MNFSPRIPGICLASILLAASAFAVDPSQQGSASPVDNSIQAAPQETAVEAQEAKPFQYGPIRSTDPEVRAEIQKLYRDQAELDLAANAQIDALVKSIENVNDSDLQLRVQQEIMETKKQMSIKNMEIGLQIARLNEDELRVADYEKALDQILHPEKYLPQTQDPSFAEERARQMGLK